MDIWLRRALKSQAYQVLDQVKQQSWINPVMVDDVIKEFDARRVHWSRVWALVALGSVGL